MGVLYRTYLIAWFGRNGRYLCAHSGGNAEALVETLAMWQRIGDKVCVRTPR